MGQSYAKKHTFLNRPAEPVSAADFADSQARCFARKMLKTANEKHVTGASVRWSQTDRFAKADVNESRKQQAF
ncbi:MAG: hypothetical protein MUD08_19025 [Cytophagales bacterium]|nr:hypothetical protein [Cytophagales bacterium]